MKSPTQSKDHLEFRPGWEYSQYIRKAQEICNLAQENQNFNTFLLRNQITTIISRIITSKNHKTQVENKQKLEEIFKIFENFDEKETPKKLKKILSES